LVNHYHLWFFVKVGSGFRPKKIMRLAHAAFGGGSPNALLALSGRRAATAGKSFRLHFSND